MRTLLSIAALMTVAMPAFAVDPASIPEPQSLALLGIGVAALLMVRRKKK